jgi:2-methylcitrate dehydratase PrpD
MASGLPTAAQRLAAWCADLTWERLPTDVHARAAELTLDLLGVAIRGSTEPSTGPVRAVVNGYVSADGASGVGVTSRLVPSAAALLNGTAAHAIELDDVTRESSLHPGVAVIPAALAIAEHRTAGGRAFLEAVVAGYEVVIRVGNALNPASAYARGFHPTGVAGAFGAAVAAARLMGLDAPAITNAIGIAGTMASGSLEYLSDGSWTKRLNAGWAANVGVTAAELAAAGFTGPASALEGRLGTLHAYTDAPRSHLLVDGLAESYQISRVATKPYGCCRYNHGLIDGVLRIRAEYAVDPSAVRRIRLGVLSAGALLVADPIDQKRAPRNPVDAQFSAPFAAAIALVHGAAGASQYSQLVVDDPAIRALMAVTDCYSSPDLDAAYPERWPAAVEIEMTDGRVYETRVEYALGEPENPLPGDALRLRFRDLVGDRLPASATQQLEDATMGLHGNASIRPIADVLRMVRAA